MWRRAVLTVRGGLMGGGGRMTLPQSQSARAAGPRVKLTYGRRALHGSVAGRQGPGGSMAALGGLRALEARPHPLLWSSQMRSLFIQSQTTPNPAALQFLPGRTVLEEEFGSGVNFGSYAEAQQSALAKRIFQLEGVTNVFLGREFVTINLDTKNVDWHLAKPQIFSLLMDFFASEVPVMSADATATHGSQDTDILDDDSEVVAMIKELVETRIRPSVQEDGGDIYFRRFDEETGIVYLELAGSCAGCPSSEITLKHGVENMLKYYIPEVTSIMAIEDPNLDDTNEEEVANYDRKLSFKPQS